MNNIQELLNREPNINEVFQTKKEKEIDYLPSFEKDGIVWDILEIHICIDWGGRQAELVCQSRELFDNKYLTKSFSIYPKNPYLNEIPNNQKIVRIIHNMFLEFDTTNSIKQLNKEIK
jgi:hypothetical protein